jgi:hypothetical protein
VPDPDAETRRQYQELQTTLASVGPHLALAHDRVAALLEPSQPAGAPDAEGDEPTAQDHLDSIVQHTTNAASAAQAVAGMAVQLGGAPVADPPPPPKALTRAARERVLLKLVAAVTAMQRTVTREGRRNSAADQAVIQHVHDLAGQLGAVATPSCAPAEAPKQHLMLDGKWLGEPDPLDDFDLDSLDPKEIAAVIGRVIAEQLTRVTGKLPD